MPVHRDLVRQCIWLFMALSLSGRVSLVRKRKHRWLSVPLDLVSGFWLLRGVRTSVVSIGRRVASVVSWFV